MKKIFITVVLLTAIISVKAQDMMMSKKGTPILPEAGDWSIGISATDFIDWAFDKAHIMTNSQQFLSSSAVKPQKDMTLVGLYMKDANTAYRGRVRIGFTSHTDTEGSL